MKSLLPAIFYLISSSILLHTFLCGTPVSSYEYSPSNKKSEYSRFKSLDRVINRLDGGVSTSTVKVSGSGDNSNKSRSRLRELNLSDPSEPQDFPEVEDEELDDDDDSMYEDENETEVLNDNTSHWNNPYRSSHYRPSKYGVPATTTTTTTTTTPSPPLSYSQMKWRDLGSRQAVEQSRLRNSYSSNSGTPHNQYSYSNNHRNSHQQSSNHNTIHQNNHGGSTNSHNSGSRSHSQPQQTPGPDTSIREAINHALKVSREGSCKIPKPRLVRVQDFYPHPGKTYVPHCTILHQCSDDTGCCRHDVLTCSPKTTQRVELYFYTILAENNRASSVERLVFYNHTECECRDKMEDLMPRDVPITVTGAPEPSSVTSSTVTQRSVGAGFSIIPRNDPRVRNLQCKCPSEYTERVLQDGSCTCDCFDKQRECLRLKKGKDFFTMQDKWCIQSGRCEIPGCTYGSYIHLIGRCPRKQERSGSGQSLNWHRYVT